MLLIAAALLSACGGGAAAPQPTTAPQPTAAPQPTEAPQPTTPPQPTEAPQPTTPPQPTEAPQPTAEPQPTSAPTLTGAGLLARGNVAQRPFVVMVDNHPNAYPQSGLDHASIVFEALAEFGLTRFMAVYEPGQAQQASQIGPVRSTRLYFAQWALPFNGIYAHAGGSPQGLQLVENTDQLVNLDALFRSSSGYFRRNEQRPAPHNLYTSGAELARAGADQGLGAPARSDIGFLYKADAPADQRPAAQTISYFFLYREDSIGWTYDPASNSYGRLRRGQPAIDAVSGAQLRTRNIVIMQVAEAPIEGDEKGRIEQQVVGSGKARLYQDGVEREVTWQKDSPEGQLIFLDPSGTEVSFNAGQIWLVAIPSLDNISVGG